jgi:Kef-type K+ transport system membrane component KefB
MHDLSVGRWPHNGSRIGARRVDRIGHDLSMLATEVLYSVEMGLLLLASCVLIGPILAERVRVPGLIGLIAVGMLLGPNVLEWLRIDGFVATVGVAGLLYLMFTAGVELDLKTFAANRTAAITFGLLTFVIPFTLSFLVGRFVLDFGLSASALVGAMWASHTVVAYPEAKAAGLDRNRAVSSAVAATVITDVLALVVLAVAASSAAIADEPGTRSSEPTPALPLWAALVLVVVFCVVLLPRATRWMFAHVLHSRTQRYVWLLGGMAAGATVGLLGGVEGLVGAFLAGIGMNSSVPSKSELMERVEFVGNSLLVPAFLVSVGLSIDPAAVVEPATLAKAALFTGLVVVGKTLPAVIAGLRFGFARAEIAIMATLTIGQAAATLAIAQVGVATGLFDQEILNAAVVTVVATVLITSFGTRLAAKKMPQPETGDGALGEHVIVRAGPVPTAGNMARLASAIALGDNGLITPFAEAVGQQPGDDRLSALTQELTHLGHDTLAVRRVADSMHAAALSLSREVQGSMLLLAIDDLGRVINRPVASELDIVGADSTVPCVAAWLTDHRWTRIVVVTGRDSIDAARRRDVELVADLVTRLGRDLSGPVIVFSDPASLDSSAQLFPQAAVAPYTPGTGEVLERLAPTDLVVVPTHVVADAGVLERQRLRSALDPVSLVVVGGPGRMRTSLGPRPRQLMGLPSRDH